ncbi:unnamed protein product [Rhizoctonia solani]|nr:unnamed protein product [Rhizoctonia solani]
MSTTNTKSLSEYLDATPEVDRCELCIQISSGLAYLHGDGVVHGSLRAANILVSLAGKAIVSDPLLLGNISESTHGKAGWLAPEVIKGEASTRASDVYSLGMTMLEVISGTPSDLEKKPPKASNVELSDLGSFLPERPEKSIPTNTFQEESFELSDIESVSSTLSGGDTTRNGPAISEPNADDQGLLGPESRMMARKVLKQLAAHGCENLTGHIDRDSFSALPFYDGGFGDVYHGKLFSGLRVAVKVPRVSLRILEENPDYLTDVAREIHSWKKCDHPNVLHFLGLAEFRGQIGMVAPWMENGSLPRYLEKAFDADRCKLCTQICEGVAYLHEIGIVCDNDMLYYHSTVLTSLIEVHGDLKGENVLISSKGVAVVADFGGSLLKNRSLKIVPPERGLCFSIRWAAPELLGGDQEGVNTKESDIYALGMTILRSH